MRKVILGLAVSLDGFIEGPNGEYDWCYTDQDYGMSAFFKNVDAIFIGRKSYEMSLGTDGGGDMFPRMKEYVFSNTLKEIKRGELVSGDIEAKVKAIKKKPGKDIWLFGGAELTRHLMNLRLVDLLWLSVHPILLGSGKPLFSDIKGRVQLKLIEAKSYNTGLVSMMYEVKKSR